MGFSTPWGLGEGRSLVQGGDKNDRGPKTYEVNEYFRNLKLMFPDNLYMLMGNHEEMLIDAAKRVDRNHILWINGGRKTLESYSRHTQLYGLSSLGNSLVKTGHFAFLTEHLWFLETPDYFFSHAPIPQFQHRQGKSFEAWCGYADGLVWSPHLQYMPRHVMSDAWVDRRPFDKDLLFIHGHIHDLEEKRGAHDPFDYLMVKPVRRYGQSFLVDTGCGCYAKAPLTYLALPELLAINSDGQSYEVGE